jgi:aspartate carbamoyltransferase
MPPRIYGFDEISCKNENCISSPKNLEGVTTEFLRKSEVGSPEGAKFICRYCEREHAFRDIWDL